MRPIHLLILLLAAGLAHAQYAMPPLAEVRLNNSAVAGALDGYYNGSYAYDAAVTLRFHDYTQSPAVSASAFPVALTPAIDNVSCVTDNLSLIYARGYEAGPLVSKSSVFSCDLAWHGPGPPPSSWQECDFDGDDCSEFVNRTLVSYDLNATFLYKDSETSVPLGSTMLTLPPQVIAQIENASGADNLTVVISGTVTFTYEVNDQYIDGPDCYSNFTNFSAVVPVAANSTFIVGGRRKLFFLAAPVLREQWFRNNRFDVVVLSQCPLHSAEVLLNNASARNATLRSYGLSQGGMYVMSITTNATSPEALTERTNRTANPLPLESANNSFAYAYRFNFSYAGLGENNLSLVVRDAMLAEEQYNETLLSRMVSFGGNTTETGENAALVPSRPSAAVIPGVLAHLEVSLGLVGLVLILAFLNFWVPR
jgi:hypothetical protein